ncbi:MAG TPA: lysine-sensitive aspartokinase 3 [Longimicrobiales bacterium]|nr:lysine-sensitive aspartokinase 3 [Longimicrobiales bacterium]
MQPLIMKFGGTSVEDAGAMERVARIVDERKPQPRVVVVSALRGMTDALLQAVRSASAGDVKSGFELLTPQFARHDAIAAEVLPPEERARVETMVAEYREEIVELLRIVNAHPGTLLPLQDEIVAYGERLSGPVAAAVMRAAGVPAEYVDARRCIVTNEEHGRAAPIMEATFERTRSTLLSLLEAGTIPVLGGFISSAESGATTTLGRGGSDYSAAIFGAALDAAEIQIWTDVTGFLTADPRVVPEARPIARLSYAEAAELAFFGAKVLHPKTIQPAVEKDIPVRICNSREPHHPGTLINGDVGPAPGGVRAIAHKPGISIVQVESARMLGAYGFLRALFEVFDRFRTAVDVVSTSEVSVSLSLEDTRRLPEIVTALEELGTVRVSSGNAIVSVVGEGIGETPGIAARVFGTIQDTRIRLISQGASNINITFLVPETDVNTVVRRLHAEFFGSAG